MRCTKNPRLKNRAAVQCAERALEIYFEHIGILLRTLHRHFMRPFSYRACREFVAEYTDTVNEFDEDPDVTDHMIDSCLKDMPYLTRERAVKLVRCFAKRAKTPLDRAIYSDRNFESIFAQNLLLMLIQLHFDYCFGEKRMTRLFGLLETADLSDPMAWLKNVGVELSQNDNSAYELIAKTERKSKPTATLREQLDARRQLEALRAYQSETMK